MSREQCMKYLKIAFRLARSEDEHNEKRDFEEYLQDKVVVKLKEVAAYITQSG
jgi:hypothetical protein